MRIIGFIHKNSGVSFHRLIVPLLLMQGQGIDAFLTNDEPHEKYFEKGCDMVIYNRTLPMEMMVKIDILKIKYGFKICVDIDDHWELDPHHILYNAPKENFYKEEQIRHIKNADVVTCTHERLRDEILPFNKNVYILPNAIPKQGQFDIERIPHHLTRLFWQGTCTHEQDIALLRAPIYCLSTIAGKIKMVMAGIEDEEEKEDDTDEIKQDKLKKQKAWERMINCYTSNMKHQCKLIGGKNVREYYSSYAEADICLIPLVNSPFNKMKSNLKVLEAANLALPVICSEVHPYLGLPVLYAKGTGDWVHTITKLVNSKKRQKDAGEKLKEFCDQHFNFHKINNERKEILEHVCKTVSV